MARVAGINIPDNKHIEISLTYIFVPLFSLKFVKIYLTNIVSCSTLYLLFITIVNLPCTIYSPYTTAKSMNIHKSINLNH